jgi:hypothetical protein
MKVRWWFVGIVAVAAGSMFMIKHFVDIKKAFLPFVDHTNGESFGTFPHEILETEFEDTDYLA